MRDAFAVKSSNSNYTVHKPNWSTKGDVGPDHALKHNAKDICVRGLRPFPGPQRLLGVEKEK